MLGLLWVIVGLLGHLGVILGHLGAVLDLALVYLAVFWSHLGAILGHLRPSWGLEGTGGARKTTRKAYSAKFARRLGESTISEVPGSHFEALLGPC